MKNILTYDHPAAKWENGMALGNGRLGAMLLGNMAEEHIWLNEDTLWSGQPGSHNNKQSAESLQEIQMLLFDGRFAEAEMLINKKMPGEWTESYMPMADVQIEIPELQKETEEYHRQLDIGEAVETVSVKKEDRIYRQESFISYPAQCMSVRYSCTGRFKGECRIHLTSQLHCFYEHEARNGEEKKIRLTGWCPTHVEPDYYSCSEPILYDSWENTPGIRFQVGMDLETDGVISGKDGDRTITGMSYVQIWIASANSFVRYDRKPDAEFRPRVEKRLADVRTKNWQDVREEHIRDYQHLFNRVEIDLGHGPDEGMDTRERLKRLYDGARDPEMIATAFQYSRYLLISSSRKGTQPATLQGLWNDCVRPKWSSNYTMNINLQMNYWLAETCNLQECAEPLITFIREIAETGKDTAEVNYGCRGWCCHHNSDLWRNAAPVGSRAKDTDVLPWSVWPMGSGWLCEHLWEHYLFTEDKLFLEKTAWPLMKSAAVFYLDFMVEHNGEFVTCPSGSPENHFMICRERHSMYYASSMDVEIIRELFSDCLEAAEIIGDEKEAGFTEQVKMALGKLPPFKVGRFGQLQEWYEDFDEEDPEHRHLSHLYALHPSNQISPSGTPELAEACRVVLRRRGEKSTPWSRCWKIAMYARLHDGNKAGEEVHQYMQFSDSNEISYDNGGILENLFCARPLQIDGALGFAAAVAEMLIQSQDGEITYLPALPESWKNGRVKGLCVRHGYEVEIRWEDGKLREHTLIPCGVCER